MNKPLKNIVTSRDYSVHNLKVDVKPKQRKRTTRADVTIHGYLFTDSPYRMLNSFERCMMIELLALAKRYGTDKPLGLSARSAGKACNMSPRQAAYTLKELEKKGFIVNMTRGYKNSRERTSSSWRLTCLPYQSELPTWDYIRIHYKLQDISQFEATQESVMWGENDRLQVP
jgi:hypothetical protein